MQPLAEEETLGGSGRQQHPVAAFFHIAFKAAAIFLYLFSTWFVDNFVLVCVLCIVLTAFDFWTVKNVSGRLLVGLRWWNNIKEDGSNEWVFESNPHAAQMVHPSDSRIFWLGIYGTPLVWVALAVVAVLTFKFDWLLICAVALGLSVANVIGYTKCRSDAKAKASMAQGVLGMVGQPGSLSMLSSVWKAFRGSGEAGGEQNPQPPLPTATAV